MLAVGAQAPDFAGDASNGRKVSLRELRGTRVVLYFYPASFTPGCSAEARMFRDNHDLIRRLGAEVVGISTDDLETQCRFADAERLPFPVLSDARRVISTAYDVLWPIVPIDKRVTYILDERGIIQAVFRHEFLVSLHLADVLGFLRSPLPTPGQGGP